MRAVFLDICGSTLQTLAVLIVLAAIFTLLSAVAAACNKGLPWWRKPDLSTDLCWMFLPKLIYGFAQTTMLTLGVAALYGISDPDRFVAEGHGPLAGLGLGWQMVLYLLGNDLIMYLTHRAFHTARLWRFHAVHHSSQHLEWTSANRFHPVDQIFHSMLADTVMLLLGISPDTLVWLMPFGVGSSALVHANLNWTFGPFRYVMVSPVFHRWHHTGPDRGGSSNFASTFPIYDLIFGTFYMPAGELPDQYGVDDPHFPRDFIRQVMHPFLPKKRRAAPGVAIEQP